ncbi:MAG: ATP-binding protein [Actinobacteria bacterium]|nr:ATP-binding protein [Actinomycetota bacterium]
MIIRRDLQDIIEKWLFKGKILIIYGARQVGKTTLVKTLVDKYESQESYFNCDIIHVRQQLEKKDPISLRKFLGNEKIIVLDEAQRIPGIGLTLKILIDTYPDLQIIATGSSSFELSNKIMEPLTGRALEFILYPFFLNEMLQIYKKWELDGQIENILRYGSYPEIVLADESSARILLDNLTGKYIYKDILEFESMKRSDLLVRILQMIALQIGSEVSIHEIANSLRTSSKTIERYIDLLEKAFVLFRLRSFNMNLRNEIKKRQKIYFYDSGIRNSLINRYNPLEQRDDVGFLWENFIIIERMKFLHNREKRKNMYFWKTHDKKEIDYIEEYDGNLDGYEFKWKKTDFKIPAIFLETYKNSKVNLINRENYMDFLTT